MIAIDTNILLSAANERSQDHRRADRFLNEMSPRMDVGLSEFALAELYVLLRNPKLFEPALDAGEAAAVIQGYRNHPFWRLFGFPKSSGAIHDALWQIASTRQFARRRLYDVRMALTLQAFGVTDFATVNVRDFKGLGFRRVWNPLEDETP